MYVLTWVGIELSQTLIWTGKRQSKTKQKYEIEHLVATSKRCSWLPELVLSSNPWSAKTNTFQVAKNYFWQNGKILKLRIAMHTRPLTRTARRPQEVAISWKITISHCLVSCGGKPDILGTTFESASRDQSTRVLFMILFACIGWASPHPV